MDLSIIPFNYVQRSVFRSKKGLASQKFLTVSGSDFLESYRVANREMLNLSSERTFITCLIPPQKEHIYTIVSTALSNNIECCRYLAASMSLPYDFYVRSLGSQHANTDLIGKPLPEFRQLR